jgi:hypothetical protein
MNRTSIQPNTIYCLHAVCICFLAVFLVWPIQNPDTPETPLSQHTRLQPTSDGGSDITEYSVVVQPDDGAEETHTVQQPATRLTVKSLPARTSFSVKVAAANAEGSGPYSEEVPTVHSPHSRQPEHERTIRTVCSMRIDVPDVRTSKYVFVCLTFTSNLNLSQPALIILSG